MSTEPTRPAPPGDAALTDAPPAAPTAVLAAHDALPAGTRFGEFEIIRVLGVGGFGIVYLAQDHSLERQVALKEYMPVSLAERGDGPLITVRVGSHAETYAIGLRSFINEARLLARFDHPALVKVYRFWEDNATAYMVMPYLQGITLRDARRGMARSPDEAWIRSLLEPMLDALEHLHRGGVFHRDIAPDNVLLPPVGGPILLDFGAARRVISDRTQSLTAILKPTYAPIEQYAEMTAMRQGAWTDIYALGAVLHFLLFAAPPAPATARALQSDAVPIEHRIVPGVSPRFIAIVAWMLGVRPSERPQNVAELRVVLNGQGPVPTPTPPTSISILPPASRFNGSGADDTVLRPSAPAVTSFPATHVATAFQPTMLLDRSGVAPADHAAAAAATAPAPRRNLMAAGLAAGLLAAAMVLWQFFGLLGGSRPNGAAGRAAASAVSALPIEAQASEAAEPAAPAVATRSPTLTPALTVLAGVAAVAPAAAAAAATAAASGAASRPRPAVRPVNLRNPDRTLTTTRRALALSADKTPARSGNGGAARKSARATRAAAAPVPRGPVTAREACGSRVFIALAICMDRECEQRQFRDNPECVRVLNVKRQRADR